MDIRKYSILLVILFLTNNLLLAAIPERCGWWKFDNPSDLTKAESGFGQALTLVGSHLFTNGPVVGNGASLIGVGSYYKMNHLISPNGGGTKVNEYTLQFDFKIHGNEVWHSFFQTTGTNIDDGDFFINKSGNIGVAAVGYSAYSVIPNEWYRLIISVKNGNKFTCYLDGKLLYNGMAQAIDGRFSLSDLLLIFADDNGEDASIYCAELAIWNQALDAAQANELGGFGHNFTPSLMTRVPYLQGQGQTTMYVCWHDTAQDGTKVEYGLDSNSLHFSTQGTSEIVSGPYCWHSVKLTGLHANTRYFYKVASGIGISRIYSFKTLPDASYSGKIRFVILGDTHASDTTMAGKVIRAAKAKIEEMYGPDIENHIIGIFHSGDIVVSGNSPDQYTTQYFRPLSVLSVNLPTMVVAGNHEGESPYFYQYLKLEDQSAFPTTPALNEKIWQLKIGNTLFIGLNTNIVSQYGATETAWLDTKLNETEIDPSIDFVFLFFHHPPFSELWYDVNNFDGGSDYVKNVLFPIIKKYSKVQQLHYGHTHGFERGTIQSDKLNGDFRIICGGGGGGPLDPWDVGSNHDYEDIHIDFSNYFFQILEIDIANQSYQNSAYSLGTISNPRNSELLDTWHKNITQPGPGTPIAENFVIADEYIQFNTSKFYGIDSIMSVRLQVIDSSDNSHIVVDSLVHWKNIYGIDNNFNPIDKNRDINLYQIKIKKSLLSGNKSYYFRVRYRDHNLKWSNWSNSILTKAVGLNTESINSNEYFLNQNYPNPFQNTTSITYNIMEKSEVIFRIYDKYSRLVDEINEGVKVKGIYEFEYKAEKLDTGLYFYELNANKFSITKKMIKLK